MQPTDLKSTHSGRLDRWLGAEHVAGITRSMHGWYGPPIAVHGVPGAVYATSDGDFIGEIRGGQEMCAVDRAMDSVRRHRAALRLRNAHARRQAGAFANLSAILAAGSGGKAQNLTFSKTGVASNAIGNAMDLFYRAGQPAAGAAGAAAPGGTVPTSASTGALGYVNPVNANSGHFATGYISGSVAANTLLMYDRLFSVAKTMNSVATEAVTGTFARYQNTVGTAADYIGGNFSFPVNPTTVLPATAHNWTVGQYTDQANNAANSFPSIAGISACVVGGIDLAVGSWFMPLAAGDVGVKALTQMQCSALVATGTIDFVVGHPIAYFPCPIANMVCIIDGINNAFNLQFVYDNACLSFLEMPKPATTATNYNGMVTLVAE